MTPAPGSLVAEMPRAGVGAVAAVRASLRTNRGKRARPAGNRARLAGKQPSMTYDSAVPVLAIHDENDPAAQHVLLGAADDTEAPVLPVMRAIPPQPGDPSDAPASADDPVAPGLRVTLFEQAVEQNSRRLLAIARAIVGYRASPEDVVQQAVMNLYRHRARYDWRKPGGLLKRAVVNEALRLLRPPRMTMVADDHPAAFRAPSTDMETNETVRKVREAIDQLPEHFRAALILCEYEQMSYAQIAETLDASIPQIKTWLHRARRKLATILEPYMAQQHNPSE